MAKVVGATITLGSRAGQILISDDLAVILMRMNNLERLSGI